MNANLKALVTSGMFAFTAATLAPSSVLAQNASVHTTSNNDAAMNENRGNREDGEDRREERQEANDTLADAVATAEKMKADEDLDVNMSDVKGVFIVPNYARAALGVGGSGGEGVLFVREGGDWKSNKWSQPLFYNVGAISAGAQAGVEAGEIAMLLMTQEAVDAFMQENNFSLNADAGLTIVAYSARAQATAGKGDIVIWSDTAGLFGDLAINVENIFWDDEENASYHGKNVDPNTIMTGKGKGDRNKSQPMNNVLQ